MAQNNLGSPVYVVNGTTNPLTVTSGGSGNTSDQVRGAFARGVVADPNPVVTGGRDSTGTVRTQLTDANGAAATYAVGTNNVVRRASSGAGGAAELFSSSPITVLSITGETGGTKVYLQLYNKAGGSPVIGTDTPFYTYPIGANSFFTLSLPAGGVLFTTGLGYALTTDVAATTGSAAAAVLGMCLVAR